MNLFEENVLLIGFNTFSTMFYFFSMSILASFALRIIKRKLTGNYEKMDPIVFESKSKLWFKLAPFLLFIILFLNGIIKPIRIIAKLCEFKDLGFFHAGLEVSSFILELIFKFMLNVTCVAMFYKTDLLEGY